MQILISPYYYYWYYLLLRIDYTKVYFLLDMYCTLKSDELYIVNIASDYLKNTALTTHTLFNKNSYVPSLSGIYPAYN